MEYLCSNASSSSSLFPSHFLEAYDEVGDHIDEAMLAYFDAQLAADAGIDTSSFSVFHSQCSGGMRPPTVNNIFLSPAKTSASMITESTKGGGSKEAMEPCMDRANKSKHDAKPSKSFKHDNRRGPIISNSKQKITKKPDPKKLKRLAQNREAARKSRLKKKAYVEELESSRIRLLQLEHELLRERAQGIFLEGGLLEGGGDQGCTMGVTSMSSDGAVFDTAYIRWVEEHHRLTIELRAALQEEHLPENHLKIYVDKCLAHYDIIFNLKSRIAKSDVFHLVSGMWMCPAERCFSWLGGFRPSKLIKIIMRQIEPLTEQQVIAIWGLQECTQEAEEASSHGLDALYQSLPDTIAFDALSWPPNMAMDQAAIAMNNLSVLEHFILQADGLRQQMLHRLCQILTTREAARCFVAIGEHFHRLRGLSSLWLARPSQE